MDKLTLAMKEAQTIRWGRPVPVRVYINDEGQVIWSMVEDGTTNDLVESNSDGLLYHVRSVFVPHGGVNPLKTRATPSADDAWPIGMRVTKTKGSSWTGKIVGHYSTSLTPIGVAVESENEPGSVQIYPVTALARLDQGEG